MTTQKKKPVAKTTTKKSTSSITVKELNNVLTETLAKVRDKFIHWKVLLKFHFYS